MALYGGDSILAMEIERAKGALVWDGAWANVVGVLTGGVLLVGFALELGAGPLTIGIVGGVPFFSRLAQIPAIVLIERLRERRRIAIIAATGSRTVVLGLAFIPFIDDRQLALAFLVLGCIVIATLGAVGACAWNSWMHDLLPKEQLGRIFSRRLFLATGVANLLTLRVWGRLSTCVYIRADSAVGARLYPGAFLARPSAAPPAQRALPGRVPGVTIIVRGTATAAIGLAAGNIGLKSAPV